MITVFTPAYNRRHTLDKLYRSLNGQTCLDFEWLVIDDGTTDGTEEWFEGILSKDNLYPVTYIKQENGGKHRAINRGIKLAKGELFFIVDSDDSLLPSAIEKLSEWAEQVRGLENCAGISGMRGLDEKRYLGSFFDGNAEYIDATNLEREKYRLLGDKAEAYFTNVLLKYPFPEFEGEKFITEEVVWNKIAMDGYFLRWYKDIIYICEYLDDGLTKSGNEKYRKSPQGTLYQTRQQLEIYKKNFKKRTLAINFYYERVKGEKSISEAAKDMGVSVCRCRFAVFTVKCGRFLRKILGRG